VPNCIDEPSHSPHEIDQSLALPTIKLSVLSYLQCRSGKSTQHTLNSYALVVSSLICKSPLRYYGFMLTSLPLEAARPLLRLLKEIWETKSMLISMATVIHFGFPHGFRGLWAILTTGPKTPVLQLERPAVIALRISIAFQILVAWWMWGRFRRAQTHLPLPWKDIDMADIFEILSAPSPLRGLHFLCVRFGSRGRQIARQNPWHFRHSLMTAHYSMVLFGLVRIGGPNGFLLALHLLIQYETFWLLYRQSEAAFGHLKSTKRLSLDYRYRPRFAQAAVLQLAIFGLNIVLVCKQHPIADYLLVALPITATATLLLYIKHGHKTNFINLRPTIYGTPHDRLCRICTSAMKNTGADSGEHRKRHHATKSSLQQSAQRGCRICAAVWQHASKIPEDFVQSLKIWESFTWISNQGLRTIVCNGVDTEFEYRNDKGKLSSKLMQINQLNSYQYPIGGTNLTKALIFGSASLQKIYRSIPGQIRA
jgi:hypothetical protein